MELKFETGHTDTINDVQFDFSGTRIATASSDKVVKIFKQGTDKVDLLAELKGHNGAVTSVSWSHPSFGNLIATSSYDRSVIIWREHDNNWEQAQNFQNLHKKSINTVSWAPSEYGLVLAAASSDGLVSIIRYQDYNWNVEQFQAHNAGVLSLSWGPYEEGRESLVTGGVDNKVIIWSKSNGDWTNEGKLQAEHDGWVTDVAWSQTSPTIASCSNNGEIFIYSLSGDQWEKVETINVGDSAWRLNWSSVTNILAAKIGTNTTRYYKESLGGWKEI